MRLKLRGNDQSEHITASALTRCPLSREFDSRSVVHALFVRLLTRNERIGNMFGILLASCKRGSKLYLAARHC